MVSPVFTCDYAHCACTPLFSSGARSLAERRRQSLLKTLVNRRPQGRRVTSANAGKDSLYYELEPTLIEGMEKGDGGSVTVIKCKLTILDKAIRECWNFASPIHQDAVLHVAAIELIAVKVDYFVVERGVLK